MFVVFAIVSAGSNCLSRISLDGFFRILVSYLSDEQRSSSFYLASISWYCCSLKKRSCVIDSTKVEEAMGWRLCET
jgi:hypothetical protein